MNQDAVRRTRLVCGIVLSIAAVVAGICLITACLGIYLSGGDQIYTPEKVAHGFSVIAVPVYLFLALMIAAFVLDFFLPVRNKKIKAEKNLAATLERLLSKRNMDSCESALKEQILALEKKRSRDKVITLAVLAVCSIAFLFFGANPANFHQTEINSSMVKAVLILFCCLAVPFGCALGAAYRAKASLQKEIELVKGIPAGDPVPRAPKKDHAKLIMVLRWALVCVAVAVLVYGFFAGGTADVLTKAKNICTECVGLG